MDKDSINNKLNARYKRLNNLSESIEKKLLILPEGKIRIQHRENSDYYYYVDKESNDNGMTVSASNAAFVRDLAQRAYLQKVLRAATDEYIEQWLSQPYVPLGFEPGDPYYETLNGERVRSKTETMIADRLRERHIPYKYECPLIIGNKTFYPDFTILRMSDRAELYYEHLGKMGDPDYARRNINKLNKYALNGIVQGDKLFTTMESADCPFDIRTLDKMIDINFI